MADTGAPSAASEKIADRTPENEIGAWIGAWFWRQRGRARPNALELLSATIDYAFNCRDEDSSQVGILESAVARWRPAFIEDQPCTCTDDESRAAAALCLNRWFDKRQDR